jgi:hypothetical protein
MIYACHTVLKSAVNKKYLPTVTQKLQVYSHHNIQNALRTFIRQELQSQIFDCKKQEAQNN